MRGILLMIVATVCFSGMSYAAENCVTYKNGMTICW